MSKIKHIGLIMDGNRRYAKRLMKKPWEGHKAGTKTADMVVDWLKENGVKEATFYAFSIQNFDRPKKEFEFLIKLFDKELDRLLGERMEELTDDRVRFRFIGRIDLFPDYIQEKMHKVMELTKDFDNHMINMAMAYGGQEEIVDAVKKIIKDGIKPDTLDINSFSQYLYNSNQPDIIIRTGGEKRLSNFLTFQSVYSELFFIDKLWPEFNKEDLERVIEEYHSRERRFGR